MSAKNISAELTTCDKEPIHLINTVQEHGYFLVFSPTDRLVHVVSENVTKVFGRPQTAIIRQRLDRIFSADVAQMLMDIGSEKSLPAYLKVHIENRFFEAYCYDLAGLVAVELEEIESQNFTNASRAISANQITTRQFSDELQNQRTLNEAARLLCKCIRKLTGYDRVMMYRFLPNWDGLVIAEDKIPETHSFDEHRFPASDIPLPARELYFKNRTRLIYDAQSTPSPLSSQVHPVTSRTLDLCDSKIRGVSQMHIEYLKNMFVRSSFSTAVIADERLWGLVACHGLTPISISHEVRLACETVASLFANVAHRLENLQHQSSIITFDKKLRALLQSLSVEALPIKALFSKTEQVLETFQADGMALVTAENVEITGLTPLPQQIREMSQWAAEQMAADNGRVQVVESLSAVNPDWAVLSDIASGFACVPVPTQKDAYFFLFRREFLKKITWGGDPRKSVTRRSYEGPINPRKSFEAWIETIKSTSTPWLPHEIQGLIYLEDFVFEALAKKDALINELSQKLGLK